MCLGNTHHVSDLLARAAADIRDMEQITVMIVDDHARVRQGLRTFLSTCPDLRVIAEAADGQEAVDLCALAKPDVVVMDLAMPVVDGCRATALIKETSPGTRVVALSGSAEPDMVERVFEAGAVGLVLKDSGPSALVEAIRQAADRA